MNASTRECSEITHTAISTLAVPVEVTVTLEAVAVTLEGGSLRNSERERSIGDNERCIHRCQR